MRLKEARDRAGLSQRQLAFPGCTAAYISRLEAGARVPSLQMVNQLALRLDVSGQWLATGVEPSPAEPAELLEAEVALRLGDVDEAERLYRARLQAGDPARAVALAGLGQIAFRRERFEEAITLLEDAVAPRGGSLLADPGATDTLGRVARDPGNLESAIALFERARRRGDDVGGAVETLRFSVLLANALIDAGALRAGRTVARGGDPPRRRFGRSGRRLRASTGRSRGCTRMRNEPSSRHGMRARARDPGADRERLVRRDGAPPARVRRDRGGQPRRGAGALERAASSSARISAGGTTHASRSKRRAR